MLSNVNNQFHTTRQTYGANTHSFIDKLVLCGWRDQYCTCLLTFQWPFFLVPNLSRVNLGIEFNFFFQLCPNLKSNPRLPGWQASVPATNKTYCFFFPFFNICFCFHFQDLPSFTQSVQRFVNDIRYYSLINSSLPAGSVSLVWKKYHGARHSPVCTSH